MSRILKVFLENEAALKRFLTRFFWRRQDVDDLAQETFLKAFAAEAKQDIMQPKAFLFHIARNLARDEQSKLSRVMTDSMEDFSDSNVLGGMSLKATDDHLEARQMLDLLSQGSWQRNYHPQCKQVLYDAKGLWIFPSGNCRSSSGISPSTVEKHVATGLLKCSEYLHRHGCEVDRGRLRLKKGDTSSKAPVWLAERDDRERREGTGDG